MTNQRSTLCAALLAAALTAFAAEASPPDDAAGHAYTYSYFKEQRPLKLDTTRVAVLREAAPDLSQYGLASGAAAMAVRGWWFVETTASARSDAAIGHAVSQVAGGQTVDFVSPVFLDDQGDPVVVTPHILVGFDRSLDPFVAEAILEESRAGLIIDRDWAGMKRTYRLKNASRDGFEVLEAANVLARRPEVTFAEPDMLVTGHMARIPNDTYFPYLWGLNNDGTWPPFACTVPDFDMDAPEAWDITIGDPSVLVAVLDTGVQLNHPDLNLFTPGFDATGDNGGGGPVNACDNHGTQVAGCVSGKIDNGVGVVGMAPGVRTAPARVIVSSLACDGTGIIADSWVVNGLAWAESIGARITNSSWFRNTPSSAIDQKYADTRADGMIHFASAGNNAAPTITYPSSLPTVNAVAALEPCGGLAPFSDYGPGLDFSAPGHYGIGTDRTGNAGDNDGNNDGGCLPSGILGCNRDRDCDPGNTCFLVSTDDALVAGTSFASPYVAGVAALMLSVRPNLTVAQLEAILQSSATDLGTPGYDEVFGWGLVNAFNAVHLASNPPGEATDLRVTGIDHITGALNLSYTPACESSSHDIDYGPLNQVSTYGWSGSTCGIGTTGQYAGFDPGPGSFFFVVVGDAGFVEGSFGEDGTGAERPAAGAASCGRTQLLGSVCP
jgi:subtilisin family serine protease